MSIMALMTCLVLATSVPVSATHPDGQEWKHPDPFEMLRLRDVSFNYLVFANRISWPDQPELCRREDERPL